MLKKYNDLEKIIIAIFIASILIDNINGALMLYLGTSLVTFGQIIRIFFVLFFGYLVIINVEIRDEYEKRRKFFFIPLLLFVLPFVFFIRHGAIKGLYMDLLYAVKLLFPILIIVALKSVIDNKKVSRRVIDKIFQIYSILVPLTLIVPLLLGVGFSSYELGGGYKGFYYSNNEINVVLICTFIYCVANLFQNRNRKNLILTLINLFALLLIGSKTSIIVFVTVLMVYLIKIMKKNPKKGIKCFGIGVLASLVVGFLFKDFLIDMFARMHYYYISFKNSGGTFLDFLTSGRSDRIIPAFEKNVVNARFGILNFLFGIGRYSQIDNYNLATLMEMDFFDVFNWYGIIVAVSVMYFYCFIFYKARFDKSKFGFKLMFILITLFSFIAGHVWFSALAGSALALVCVALLNEGEKVL